MLGRQPGIRRRKKAPVSTLAGAFFFRIPPLPLFFVIPARLI